MSGRGNPKQGTGKSLGRKKKEVEIRKETEQILEREQSLTEPAGEWDEVNFRCQVDQEKAQKCFGTAGNNTKIKHLTWQSPMIQGGWGSAVVSIWPASYATGCLEARVLFCKLEN